MRARCSLILAGAVLSVSAAWAATEQEAFVEAYKKFGVGLNRSTSKKPCLCVGGAFSGKAGLLVLVPQGEPFTPYGYECEVMGFGSDGVLSNVSYCVQAGGSVVVLAK